MVDQPASIGALTIEVARSQGIDVAYLPGLAMRRIADLHPGNAKTDARDAYIIAEAARSMPHALPRTDTGDEELTNLKMMIGYDDDLRGEATRISNRIRGLLLSIHPALERVLGPHLDNDGVLEMLAETGGPSGMRRCRETTLVNHKKKGAPRKAGRIAAAIKQALTEQTVTVPGTQAAELILRPYGPSAHAKCMLVVKRPLPAWGKCKVGAPSDRCPHLNAWGCRMRTAARILVEIGDISAFPSAGHLASYAGLAPVTRSSGTSIRGERPSRSGNRQLKNALFLSAFASLRAHADSKAYYDKKRGQGKRHNAALMCLARRRLNVLYAMLRDGTFFDPEMPKRA